MIGKKIKEWLKKQGINIELNPALTFFGIITFSLGKAIGEVKINPDKWSKEQEEKIPDLIQKTVKISIEEYRQLLKEEIAGKKEEEIKSEIKNILEGYKEQIEEIVRSIKEIPILTLEEFKRRKEIQKLLEYKKFIGRKEELKELHNFLHNTHERIRLIIGAGGTGKTRLAMEFAEELEKTNEWAAYFIHPYSSFSPIPIEKKTLLILDEPSRYKDRDKLIDSVLNPPCRQVAIKLLLMDRPIFKTSIESDLKAKGVNVAVMELIKGEIVEFLKENFQGIDANTAIQIERLSKNSFIYAIYYAEYFRTIGEVGMLGDVLSARVEKYMEDIKIRTNMNIEDIRNIICLISLISPIDWIKDREYLKETLFSNHYEVLENIISVAHSGYTDILVPSGQKFAIKPDPISDYLRSELIRQKDVRNKWINLLLPYMPFRISYNIFLISRFDKEIVDEVTQILGELWIELNKAKGRTPEYFLALLLFTGDLRDLPFFDIKNAEIKNWIQSHEDLSKAFPNIELRGQLAMALGNTVNHYAKANEFQKTEESLKQLIDFHERYPDKEVREKLASVLFNVVTIYGATSQLAKMGVYLGELKNLHQTYPEKQVRQELAKALFNGGIKYGEAHRFEEMTASIEELERLHKVCIEKEVREQFCQALVNAIALYETPGEFAKIEYCLKKLKDLYSDYPLKEVRQTLAMGLLNATVGYRRGKAFDKIESCIIDLKAMYKTHPDKEVKVNLAMALDNTVSAYIEKEGECPYQHVTLLYKLRFDLPDDTSKQNRIKAIETLLETETEKMIWGEYNKGPNSLKKFIQQLKAEFRDDTEVVLLMNKVGQKLPWKVLQLIGELLSS